jgi:hypothetical protein
LRGEITGTGSAGEIRDFNVWPSETDVTHLADPVGATAKVEFSTPALEQFQVFQYHIGLDLSHSVTNDICTQWLSKMSATFQ